MIQDSRAHEWRSYLRRIFLHVAVFLVVGPIIGDLILFLLMSFTSPSTYRGIAYAVSDIVSAVPLAYLVEGLAAGFTGLIVGVSSSWIPKAQWLFLVAIATGGASAVINFIAWMTMAPSSREQAMMLCLIFLTGSGSAVVCTHLTERFRRNGQAISSETKHLPDMRV